MATTIAGEVPPADAAEKKNFAQSSRKLADDGFCALHNNWLQSLPTFGTC